MDRRQSLFALLILAQAAHSVEEYVGRLWESFPPAQFLTSLISTNLERGFLVINVGLVAAGLWCVLWPMRLRWPSSVGIAWFWVAIETINGVGHPTWSLLRSAYAPGVATAPLLLVLAALLARELVRESGTSARSA